MKRLLAFLAILVTLTAAGTFIWRSHRPAPTAPAVQITTKATTSFFKSSFAREVPAVEDGHDTASVILQLDKTRMCLVGSNYAVVRLSDGHFAVNASFYIDHGDGNPAQSTTRILPVHPSMPQDNDWTTINPEFEAVACFDGTRIAY